jgi:glyoxylase-like metal-dependent hydrolase (beta-lactamase superfamily II)
MDTFTEEIAPGTYRLETSLPGIIGTVFSVYFIKDKSTVIIEPGPAALIPAIRKGLAELSLHDPAYIIPTHIHLDHGGGLGELMHIFPQAKAVLNQQGAKHAIDPLRLIASTKMAFGADFEDVYGKIIPVPQSRIEIVRDNSTLSLGDRNLMFIDTPGHAPHHIAIFDSMTRGLFCGEALGLIYKPGAPPLPATAPPSFDPDLYIRNMMRLRELKPKLLFYSHGGVQHEPEKTIAAVIENTKLFGDAVLRALKSERTEQAIIQYIGEFIKNRYGFEMEEYELGSNVRAYLHYFKKKGIATLP